nr:MAG TPA: hypothetical protein [Caudoviricetes sp.]
MSHRAIGRSQVQLRATWAPGATGALLGVES